MAEERGALVPAKAHVLRHPVHPVLIPFPIAFLVGALVSDVVVAVADSRFFADMSVWLTGAGLVTGVLAAAVGLIDFVAIEKARAHRTGWIHALGNGFVLGLAGLSLGLRLASDAVDVVTPWGLVLSATIAATLVVTGWTGGELSYRHGIGVALHPTER